MRDVPGILPLAGRGVTIRRGGRTLLDNVTLVLGGTGTTALLGPNGAGKTLLLRTLAGLVAPDRGEVDWAGMPPDRRRAPRLGFVFQKPVMLRRSAIANVRFVLAAAGIRGSDAETRAQDTLDWAGLGGLAHAPARTLSGGEQQRLAIARVIAAQPDILILDEPTANLDLAATATIERLIGEAEARGAKIVVVTHDVAQARRLADEVIFLHAGRVLERRPAAAFFDGPAAPEARAYLAGRITLTE